MKPQEIIERLKDEISAGQKAVMPINYTNGYTEGLSKAIRIIEELCSKPLTKDEMADIIKHNGEVGSTEQERYIEIYEGTMATIKIDSNGGLDENGTPIMVELAQLVYFMDEDKLYAYLVDELDYGYMVEYEHLDENLQQEIANYDFWHNF